jgi:hypothetical protein
MLTLKEITSAVDAGHMVLKRTSDPKMTARVVNSAGGYFVYFYDRKGKVQKVQGLDGDLTDYSIVQI